jgi:hypothetical protein
LLGLSISSVNAALILQDQSGGATQILIASPIGQSFTAEDAMISSFAFSFSDFNSTFSNGNTSILLYEGVGNTGALLHTETQTLTTGLINQFVDFDFSSVSLNPGSFYTAIVQRPNARWAVETGSSEGSQYIGGDMIISGSVGMTNDLRFRVTPLSSVPVPAAVWLFATALIGLVGFNKSRKMA